VLAARAGHTPLAIHPLVGAADLTIAAQELPDILTRLQDRSASCATRSIFLSSVSFVLSRGFKRSSFGVLPTVPIARKLIISQDISSIASLPSSGMNLRLQLCG
jgi:hypothetical protein